MSQTTPVIPPRPRQPLVLRQMIAAANANVRHSTSALLAGHLDVYVEGFAEQLRRSDEIAYWCQGTPEGRAYSAAVEEYNRAIYAHREHRAAEQQAAANAAEVAAVRAETCGRCFSSHRGEC
jgi:hypothetical protein